MARRLAALWIVLVGCGPSAEEQYDAALRAVERQQERLDALRPAYDAARRTAALAVCKEIAGFTPDESATAALNQLESALTQAADAQTAVNQSAGKPKISDTDDAIDRLLTAHEALSAQQAALSAPMLKAAEVMNKIETPGTAEANRFEEVLAQMLEVQAYKRQEERLERAKKAAEAALPAAATK
jgi:ribosome-binding protein aMBF1 (putative translation factor)